jgi:S-formylglutathione hydrolase FrmB
MFPVSEDPRKWTIMGESMGGYRALVCGLHHPEVFGGIAAFSPVTDAMNAASLLPDVCFEDVFGSREEADRKGYDLFRLADRLKEAPPVRMCCGKSDFLLDMNRRFYEKIRSWQDVVYSEGEGDHDFLYWNPRIPEVLSWIMKRMEECS